MIDVKEMERQKRAEKAKNLRYKKAIVLGMNFYDIRQWVLETFENLEDVTYVTQNDEMLMKALDGDEEEAFELRVAFAALAEDLDRFFEDLDGAWLPDCFDDFFCACAGGDVEFAGYDVVEKDYFGLTCFEAGLGQEEARKRLERLTKKELIEAAQRCYQVAVAYIGLRSRYEDLRAAVDILRAQNDGLMHGIKAIEELYDRWSEASYMDKISIGSKLDDMAEQLPEEVWVR